jgi:hypothetical protein
MEVGISIEDKLNALMLRKLKVLKERMFFDSVAIRIVELFKINKSLLEIVNSFGNNLKEFCENELSNIDPNSGSSLCADGKRSVIFPVMNQCINLCEKLEKEQKKFLEKENEIFCSFKY